MSNSVIKLNQNEINHIVGGAKKPIPEPVETPAEVTDEDVGGRSLVGNIAYYGYQVVAFCCVSAVIAFGVYVKKKGMRIDKGVKKD